MTERERTNEEQKSPYQLREESKQASTHAEAQFLRDEADERERQEYEKQKTSHWK